jgi:hypothetical protein
MYIFILEFAEDEVSGTAGNNSGNFKDLSLVKKKQLFESKNLHKPEPPEAIPECKLEPKNLQKPEPPEAIPEITFYKPHKKTSPYT